MQSFDIVIVGGGLAGASLALALRGCSIRVAVIDAAPQLISVGNDSNDRYIALSDNSRKIFTTLDIWDAFAKDAIPIRNIHVSEKDVFGVTRISAAEEGLSALAWVVHYRLLFNALRQLLIDSPDIDFFTSMPVNALELDHDGATVYAENHGDILTLRAGLLIISDGGPVLQEMAGFTSQRSSYEQTAIVTTIETERSAGTTGYERFTPHGPLAVLPGKGNRCGVVWANKPHLADQLIACDEKQFITALQDDFGRRLGNILQVGARAAYPLTLSYVKQMVNGRAIVLGNAAHTLHPVAAQGFNLTLRDIASLAEILFQTINPVDVDLHTWEKNRMRDMHRVIKFTDILARNCALPIFPSFRASTLLAFELFPPLRRLVVRGSLGLLPPLSKLASGLPLRQNG